MTSDDDEKLESEEWMEIFPDLPGFFFMYLNDALFEEMELGETTPEIINCVVHRRERPYIEEVLRELDIFLPLVKNGGINLDKFLEHTWAEKMRDYDDRSNLEWAEDIQKMLRENYTKKYGKSDQN